MSFLEYLVEKKAIKEKDVALVIKSIENNGKDENSALIELGVDEGLLLELGGSFYNIPTRKVDHKDVSFETLRYISEEAARHYKFVPLCVKDGVLEVGVVNPGDIQIRDALQFITVRKKMPFKIFLISKSNFNSVIKNYKGLRGEVTRALYELGTESEEVDLDIFVDQGVKKRQNEKTPQEAKIKEDAPVTKIVSVILRHATDGSASDIHIESLEDKVRVRFRVDGVMNTSLLLPKDVHSAVVARIKILSNLKLDEKRKPQDGRFSIFLDGRKIDFRVSTFPTHYGEKVVMRILDPEKGTHALSALGLSPTHFELMQEAIRMQYGIILITGPTGSGKTTTLYSLLNEIDKEKVNVVSLEDPIEYNISSVNQSQVRPEIGYTFANGLRSILRQDPDIIMVGEIRDKETAELAIQAALTGHLVFSTLHTNSAVGVVPRLVDMGIDPYLIAPTLRFAVAQRLMRTISTESRKKIPISDSMRTMVEKQFADLPENIQQEVAKKTQNIYRAIPTPEHPDGITGRMAAFEILKIDTEIERVILKDPTEINILKTARIKGMTTMKEDAIVKALEGRVPFEEVYKI